MLDDIGWWDSSTEEQVIVMAIEKGEIGHDGETYKVIKQEKPLYYAKVKTTYKLPSRYSGMYYDADNVLWGEKEATSSRTKEDWARLDVNDTNADFEEVDVNG